MDKKQYILTLLDALQDSRPMAKGLKILVESGSLDDKTMDALLNIFKSAVNTVADDVRKKKLEKSIQVMEKIKSAEQAEHQKDEAELAELDKMLDDF